MLPKLSIIICCFILFGTKVLSQSEDVEGEDTEYYVILPKINVREKPDANSKLLGKLSLGDSVRFLEYSDKLTKIIFEGDSIQTGWYKIRFQGKFGWVIEAGFCNFGFGINTYPRFQKTLRNAEMSVKEQFAKWVKDSILVFKGTYIQVKAKNGKKVRITPMGCNPEISRKISKIDGGMLTGISYNPQNPDMLEFFFNQTAFDEILYVNRATGSKFIFPNDQDACDISAVSPSGKYVIGISVLDENFLLADFNTSKIIGRLPSKKSVPETYYSLKWLNEKELEVTLTNYETKKIVSRKILLIPQMQWKK